MHAAACSAAKLAAVDELVYLAVHAKWPHCSALRRLSFMYILSAAGFPGLSRRRFRQLSVAIHPDKCSHSLASRVRVPHHGLHARHPPRQKVMLS